MIFVHDTTTNDVIHASTLDDVPAKYRTAIALLDAADCVASDNSNSHSAELPDIGFKYAIRRNQLSTYYEYHIHKDGIDDEQFNTLP